MKAIDDCTSCNGLGDDNLATVDRKLRKAVSKSEVGLEWGCGNGWRTGDEQLMRKAQPAISNSQAAKNKN